MQGLDGGRREAGEAVKGNEVLWRRILTVGVDTGAHTGDAAVKNGIHTSTHECKQT